MNEKYYYSLASGPLAIATTVSTASRAGFEAATCLIYMLPENICEAWELNREGKKQLYPSC